MGIYFAQFTARGMEEKTASKVKRGTNIAEGRLKKSRPNKRSAPGEDY